MSSSNHDIIIIGAGIAGLYSAYNIKKMSPNTTFLILEQNKKQYIGGRIGEDTFYGATTLSGACIGRNDTNPILKKLMKELDVPFQKSTSIIDYSKLLQHSKEYDVVEIIERLKVEYNKNTSKYSKMTFKTFATEILGEKNYTLFTIYCGYTDYEDADVYETLYNYGMDDTKGGWSILYISWKKLIDNICDFIGTENIKTSSKVTEIVPVHNDSKDDSSNSYEIKMGNGHSYYCNKVIVATTITSIMNLVGKQNPSLYNQIHGQPFLRIYAKFDKQSNEIMRNYVKHYTVVPGPLQKIIPMDVEKGVYMIAYSDNKSATNVKNNLTNTVENRMLYEKLVEQSLGIPSDSLKIIAIKDYYWKVGTHYFEPLQGFNSRKDFLNTVQHPLPGILVVGEAVSDYQGWVEGALESVKAVVNKKWIKSIF
jgi:hypothetical protein